MPGPQISLLTKAQGEPNGHVRSTHLNNSSSYMSTKTQSGDRPVFQFPRSRYYYYIKIIICQTRLFQIQDLGTLNFCNFP